MRPWQLLATSKKGCQGRILGPSRGQSWLTGYDERLRTGLSLWRSPSGQNLTGSQFMIESVEDLHDVGLSWAKTRTCVITKIVCDRSQWLYKSSRFTCGLYWDLAPHEPCCGSLQDSRVLSRIFPSDRRETSWNRGDSHAQRKRSIFLFPQRQTRLTTCRCYITRLVLLPELNHKLKRRKKPCNLHAAPAEWLSVLLENVISDPTSVKSALICMPGTVRLDYYTVMRFCDRDYVTSANCSLHCNPAILKRWSQLS